MAKYEKKYGRKGPPGAQEIGCGSLEQFEMPRHEAEVEQGQVKVGQACENAQVLCVVLQLVCVGVGTVAARSNARDA